MDENKEITCPECNGTGSIEVGKHFVTREMALDAGIPELEGQLIGAEYAVCQYCGGSGWIRKGRYE